MKIYDSIRKGVLVQNDSLLIVLAHEDNVNSLSVGKVDI